MSVSRRLLALWPVLLLAACSDAKQTPEPPRAVNVVRVEAAEALAGASYTGEVRARFEVPVSFRVGGRVVQRLVEVGDTVRRGQVLARLDPNDLRLGTEASRQALVAAEAAHGQARADHARFAELHRQGFISAAEFERHRTALEVAVAQLAQARAQLDLSRNQTGYADLNAPDDGVVTAVAAEAGQMVERGQPVLRVARSGEKEVLVSVPEHRLAELRGASGLRVSFWALPGRSLEGRLRELAPAADPVTRTFAARISLPEADDAVQYGMTAQVRLAAAGAAATVRIPATALFQKDGGTAVWVLDPASSTVKLRPVRVGSFGDGLVSVVAGLNAGETIVRAGVQKLFADEKVRVLPARTP